MTRLDDLSKTTSPGLGASKLREEKPVIAPDIPVETSAATSPLGRLTIRELYIFCWKLAIAGFLFALPFLVIYMIIYLNSVR